MFSAKYARGKTQQNVKKYLQNYEKYNKELVDSVCNIIEKAIDERKFNVDIVCPIDQSNDLSNFLKYNNYYVVNTASTLQHKTLTVSWV